MIVLLECIGSDCFIRVNWTFGKWEQLTIVQIDAGKWYIKSRSHDTYNSTLTNPHGAITIIIIIEWKA